MITAINTRPPNVTPQIRPTKILMITAIKTRPPTVTPQIRPTKEQQHNIFVFKKTQSLYRCRN